MKDYYLILGILPTAEDIVIRAAYKALSQKYHPDKISNPTTEDNRKMAEINEAYSVLSDQEKRRKYDKEFKTQKDGSSFLDDANIYTSNASSPFAAEWKTALKFYPDLDNLEIYLSRYSKRLAFSFRAMIIETQKFESRFILLNNMENGFLDTYFGKNFLIKDFAKHLILYKNFEKAKELNEAVKILGSDVDPINIIKKILTDNHPLQKILELRWIIEKLSGKKLVVDVSLDELRNVLRYFKGELRWSTGIFYGFWRVNIQGDYMEFKKNDLIPWLKNIVMHEYLLQLNPDDIKPK